VRLLLWEAEGLVRVKGVGTNFYFWFSS